MNNPKSDLEYIKENIKCLPIKDVTFAKSFIEKREFNKCFICDMNNDITYANAGEIGYKFAHNMLSEINS